MRFVRVLADGEVACDRDDISPSTHAQRRGSGLRTADRLDLRGRYR
jgi:hypothetical protein